MKKIVFTFIGAILAVSVIVGVAGCAKNSSATVAIDNPFVENYVDMDYSAENGYKPVEGLDAFDVLMAAYDHWINDTHYQRTEAFDFSTTVANQGSMSVYKRNGDEYFKQNVKITTGFQEDNIGERIYFDGEKAWSIYFNDAIRAPGEKDALFAVTDWGKYEEWKPGDRYKDLDDLYYNLNEDITAYAWQDRANYTDDCDYTVYEKDGKYYFTLTINCSKEMMDGAHVAARDEILKGTGGDEGTLDMKKNTKCDYIVTPLEGGGYRFEAWRRGEEYSGSRSIIKVTCKQTTICVFSYDAEDYTITDAEKLNLA